MFFPPQQHFDKKKYFVLFIAIISGYTVDSDEDKDPVTSETASPVR